MRLILTCPEETKDVLAAELAELGATAIEPGYRAVHCEATDEVFYSLHLKLRTASRILRVLREFTAKTPEMLYSQARRVPWHDIFDVTRTFVIEGVPGDRGDGYMRANDISMKVREAIQDVFHREVGRIPRVDLKEPKVVVVAFVRHGRCILSLDTTGKALHKRGYRVEGHPAPLKETLAAAVLKLAGYDGTQTLLDPMCGSGTLAIEAAMIALGKAPLIHRKKGEFLFEWLKDFDRDLWRRTQDTTRAERLETPAHGIYASDISESHVELARKAALRARVERNIAFQAARFQDLQAPAPTGLIVANLPYGARLNERDPQLADFYKEIGDTLKRRFSGWRAALLVAEDSPWKHIGLKPTRRIPILNGSIDCRLLVFDLYEGTRKKKAQDDAAPHPDLS